MLVWAEAQAQASIDISQLSKRPEAMHMRHFIDPIIDCVFKALLSAPGNENLLINFLNSVLGLAAPIVSVTIINPYNDKDYTGGKLSIVDIKASDALGVKYQVEVQLSTPNYLQNRMLYTWSSIYQKQIDEGERYHKLKPVISIWLLTQNLLGTDDKYHHHFRLWDDNHQQLLTDHCSIHVLELKKWCQLETLQGIDLWLYFFKEAKRWKVLPTFLKNQSLMRQAMKILEAFSEKEAEYHRYQSRQDVIRVELTREAQLAEGREELADVKVRAEKAEAELAELKAQLAQLAQLAQNNGETKNIV
jgi:predicted transposase/invertase (TIGR01784 family)